MLPKVKETLDSILKRFESGEIPEAISIAMFPSIDVPMKKWSLLNRLIVFISMSRDARGYRQWSEVGRYPKAGSRAIYILAPKMMSVKKKEDEEAKLVKSFIAVAVFRYEDTMGEPMNYAELKLPDFPLIEKAKEWGISVNAIEGTGEYYGYYSHSRKEIALATEAECVFFHELAHASHSRIEAKRNVGQDPLREIVAELSALTLSKLVGKDTRDYFGNSYRYITDYAEQLHIRPHSACVRVISAAEKVLNLILGGAP